MPKKDSSGNYPKKRTASHLTDHRRPKVPKRIRSADKGKAIRAKTKGTAAKRKVTERQKSIRLPDVAYDFKGEGGISRRYASSDKAKVEAATHKGYIQKAKRNRNVANG